MKNKKERRMIRLIGLLVVLVFISSCSAVDKIEQAAHEIAVKEGLDTDQFEMQPGDCLEGSVFCYVDFFEIEDGTYVAVFEDSAGKHARTPNRYLKPSLKWLSYDGENLPIFESFPQWFYPRWQGKYYTIKLEFIDSSGVATVKFEEW